jgi:hypothetical protein
MASLATFIVLSTSYLIYMTITSNISKTTTDSRVYAQQWVESTIPEGARIAIESYAPFIDPAKYDVSYFHLLTLHPPEWYRQQEYDLLIFSSGRYYRYFQTPERYPEEVSLYNSLWNSFSEVATFDQHWTIIRVFQVDPSLIE